MLCNKKLPFVFKFATIICRGWLTGQFRKKQNCKIISLSSTYSYVSDVLECILKCSDMSPLSQNLTSNYLRKQNNYWWAKWQQEKCWEKRVIVLNWNFSFPPLLQLVFRWQEITKTKDIRYIKEVGTRTLLPIQLTAKLVKGQIAVCSRNISSEIRQSGWSLELWQSLMSALGQVSSSC